MKTPIPKILAFLATITITTALAQTKANLQAESEQLAQDTPSLHIAILTDDTGIELKDAGITSIVTSEDLLTATTNAIRSSRHVTLHFGCVNDRANPEEDFVSQYFFSSFEEIPPPRPDLRKLPGTMADKAKIHRVWTEKRQLFLRKWAVAVADMKNTVDEFHIQCLELQASTQDRFDSELQKRGTFDFPRSDIRGIIPIAAQMLESDGNRFLILNSDCVDSVEWRDARTMPFSTVEIDQDIIIITTCNNLPQNPLFRTIPNQIHIVDTVQDAIALAFNTTE